MDDKELDKLLSQRRGPAVPSGLKERLKSIPARYPRPDSVWQVISAVFKDFMGAPVTGIAVCASLALGIWAGIEVEILTVLSEQEMTSFLTVGAIGEDWL